MYAAIVSVTCRQFSAVFGIAQQARVLAQLTNSCEDCRLSLLRWSGISRKNPEISALWFTHDRPTIVVGVIQNPVVAEKWSEKADLQFRALTVAYDLSLSLGGFQLTVD